MNEMTITEMQSMQRALQEKYIDKWGGLSPAIAREKLLWMMIEAGEMADVIKKQGDQAILNDVMLCYGITPEELTEVYRAKHQRNMTRW